MSRLAQSGKRLKGSAHIVSFCLLARILSSHHFLYFFHVVSFCLHARTFSSAKLSHMHRLSSCVLPLLALPSAVSFDLLNHRFSRCHVYHRSSIFFCLIVFPDAIVLEEVMGWLKNLCAVDSISRHVLDFDFEKVCSHTNSHLNVYACLVCGRYFQVCLASAEAHLFPPSLHLQCLLESCMLCILLNAASNLSAHRNHKQFVHSSILLNAASIDSTHRNHKQFSSIDSPQLIDPLSSIMRILSLEGVPFSL